ncbi:hypothetical protein ACFX1X_020441 [Malus domestica]
MGTPYPNPITPAQTQIGWIGIGLMGAAMASRLLSAGYSLTIYARTPSKALSLQSSPNPRLKLLNPATLFSPLWGTRQMSDKLSWRQTASFGA